MTFAEFEQLPETSRGLRYELHHGEPVEMPPPEYSHYKIQQRLRRLLDRAAGSAGEVGTDLGFKLGEQEYRIADVVFVSRDRESEVGEGGYLTKAPDLVIEVLSPSNTTADLRDKRKLCLENGSLEFWVVDPAQKEVEVTTPDGRSIIYKSGQDVPVFFAPASPVAVDEIFSAASKA